MTSSTEDGSPLVKALWAGTAFFAVSTLLAVITDSLMVISVPIAIVLFVLGIVAFGFAFVHAAGRSRTELVTVPGTYFLVGSAPKNVARSMRLALVLQVAIALCSAALRPFSGVAFGILVPTFGLGMIGLWGARHGRFEPRPEPPGRAQKKTNKSGAKQRQSKAKRPGNKP